MLYCRYLQMEASFPFEMYENFIKEGIIMKTNKLLAIILACGLCLSLTACQENPMKDATQITLSNEQIFVGDSIASTSEADAVYVSNSETDHTIINITEPGTYAFSGELSSGQIAVDLGEDAKTNPEAIVTLVLNNANITCETAPAIIFYNAYECVSSDASDAQTVDTTNAGANIYVADKSTNYLNGGYVLDTYEAAVFSTVSMNINGGKKDNGELFVNAFTDKGDAICSEGYLVINGGTVNAVACSISGNAGLNAEKGILINGGNVVATGHAYDEIVGGEQNFAVFSFLESQFAGNIYEVKNKKEKTVLPALCGNDFTILVVSGKNLKEKTYSFWCEDVQFFVGEGLATGFMGDLTAPDASATASNAVVTEFQVDENADIVFDIQKGGNLFHVFY